MKLNLGCCDRPFPGFINVDLHPYPGVDQIADLAQRWPWDDSTIDEIRAWDFIEHLPTPAHSMNEIWRVLKPGGIADIVVPTTDGRGWSQDPTHICHPPWNRNSFWYFEHGNIHNTRFIYNGVKAGFRVRSEHEQMHAGNIAILSIILEAVK
jgi:predicted SAM-dependent methyltransferase